MSYSLHKSPTSNGEKIVATCTAIYGWKS